jgi:hypothetical protein
MAEQTLSPHEQHLSDLEFLDGEIARLKAAPQSHRLASESAEKLEALRYHTAQHIPFTVAATGFVETLGLTDELSPTTVRKTDAIRFVAKVLREVAEGKVKLSHYQRAHKSGACPQPGSDADAHAKTMELHNAKMVAPWDPAQDIVDHLGLDASYITAVRDLVASVKKGA